MATPTFVASYSTDYTTAGTSKSVSVTCDDGDTLLVCAFGGKDTTLSATASASGITFSVGVSSAGDATYGALYMSYALRISAVTNLSVGMTETSGTVPWGFTCYVIKDCSRVRPSGTNAGSGINGLSQNNAVSRSLFVSFQVDSNANDGTSRTWKSINGSTPTVGNGLELLYTLVNSQYGAYVAYWPLTTQGSKVGGLASPSTTYKYVGAEIVGDYGVSPVSNSHVTTATTTTRSGVTTGPSLVNGCLFAMAYVGVRPGDGTDTGVTSTVTWAGLPMTSVAKIHSNNGSQGYIEAFYLTNPPAGTNTIELTSSTTTDLRLSYTWVANVDQGNPVEEVLTSTGSSTTASIAVPNATARNALYAGMISGNNISATANSGTGFSHGATITNFNNSSDGGCSAYSLTSYPTGSGTTVGWTLANGPWALIALRLKPTSYFAPGVVYGLGI